MMTEEQHDLVDFINQEIDKWDDERRYVRVLEIALAALTQPASPALKLPENVPCDGAPEFIWLQVNGDSGEPSVWPERSWDLVTWNDERIYSDDALYVRAGVAPQTEPIEPICASGGAEWVSNERVEEIIYRAEMFGHGAGYLPDEVIPMAKELLARRACQHHWNALRLVEAGGRYQYCTLCGAKKVADHD